MSLLLASCVSQGKRFNLSVLKFSQVQDGACECLSHRNRMRTESDKS